MVGAALTQVGGVGSGLLTEAVIRTWDQLQTRSRAGIGEADLRDALAAELESTLASDTPAGTALRNEVASVLRDVQAVQVALTATVEQSAAALREVLVRGLHELGEEFSEFGWVLDDVSQQLAAIAEKVNLAAANSREMADDQQQTLVELQMLRRALGDRADRSYPAASAGPSEDEKRAAALDVDGIPVRSDCPYPGLAAFQPKDAERFYGREELTAILVARAAEQLVRPGLLIVLGPSGAGKSSLLSAGLLPAVAAGALPASGSETWPRDFLTPGEHPLTELAARIASLARIPAGALESDLRADPARITGAIRQALLTHARDLAKAPRLILAADPLVVDLDTADRQGIAGPRLLLIIDQFEEVFTQCIDEQERSLFIRALCAAAGIAIPGIVTDCDVVPGRMDERKAPALVVIGLRADFYSRATAYSELVPHLQNHQVLVGPIDEAGLRRAIEEPAATNGLVVEAGLVDVLLTDLGLRSNAPVTPSAIAEGNGIRGTIAGRDGYAAGRLALLSYALQQTWRNREGRRLTVAGYRATGRIDRAIAQAADNVYDKLDSMGQATMQSILLRLVTPGEGTPDTRRRVPLAELTVSDDSERAAAASKVLADLIDARLVTADEDVIEITHETLLTAWPRLRKWLTDDRQSLRIHRDLTDTARDWRDQGRDSSHLFRGTRLAVVREWAAAHTQDLNQDEREFLAASEHDQRHAIRRRHAVVVVLVAVILIASTTAVIARNNSVDASQQHAVALSQQLAAEAISLGPTDDVTARQLAAAAWSVSPTSQAGSALGTLMTEQQQEGILPGPSSGFGAANMVFSPDDQLLAAAYDDGAVWLWNLATEWPAAIPVPGAGNHGVAFSPNGKLLATSGTDGTVRLWNPTTRQLLTVLHAGAKGKSIFMGFSPDGTLVTADANGTVRLWNPVTGHEKGNPKAFRGSVVGLSPNARLLATADTNGTVRLWNPATGQEEGSPIEYGFLSTDFQLTLSTDRKWLAVSGGDRHGVWNLATRSLMRSVPVFRADAMSFGPHDTLAVASSGYDSSAVQIWNLITQKPTGSSFHGVYSDLDPDSVLSNAVSAMAYSPDGHLLASADQNGDIMLHNLITGQPVGAPLQADVGKYGGVDGLAFSPDGQLATAHADGYVRLWDPVTSQPVGTPLRLRSRGAEGLDRTSFSPDGRLLVTVSRDGYARLRKTVTGQLIGKPLRAFDASDGFQTIRALLGEEGALAFSPNGHLLAIADADGYVHLWNPATGQPVGTPLPAETGLSDGLGGVIDIAFSHDSHLLATADADGYVRLWNLATGQPVGTPLPADPGRGFFKGVSKVAFSPDGHLLATADADGYVRLWNPATGQPVGTPLPADPDTNNGVTDVAFSPDGHLLASADADGYIRLWDPSTDQQVGSINVATPHSSVGELAFSPDGELLADSDPGGTVQLWHVWLFTHSYGALCAEVGPPTTTVWAKYDPGEPQPRICA